MFVESYGRIALEGSSFAPGVDAVLDEGTRQLQGAGFSARSGWLTSPTFGGISWLAHSTLHSGVWVNTQGRYDELVQTDRFTLSQAFQRAGWRAVDFVPANDRDWTEGSSFYHYDAVYDRRDVGYRGPKYAYAPMPDQYVLASLQRLELAKPGRGPLFAELDLVSEPHAVDPHPAADRLERRRRRLGLPPPAGRRERPDATASGRTASRSSTRSARCSRSCSTTATTTPCMVVLGDHQPNTTVTGHDPSHDVPISIIARDPAVLAPAAEWGWVDGAAPRPDGAGLADELLPQPLPQRVRPVTGGAVARRRSARGDAALGQPEVERVRAPPRLRRQVAGVRGRTGARRSAPARRRSPRSGSAAGPCRGCC